MPDLTPFQEFVRKALAQLPEARDFYDRVIQNRLKVQGKTFYDISRGKGLNPGTTKLHVIADVLMQPAELVTRAVNGEEVEPRALPQSGATPTTDSPPPNPADVAETASVSRLDLRLPMGPGATVDDYIESEPYLFDLAYIRSFTRTPPARLRIAQGVGDSMFPTLQSGDLVWIDSTQNKLNHTDRIWAVSINGGAAIKRLRPLKDGRVLVISDNPGPGHENYEVDGDEIMIGGRVIRCTRDL